MNTEARTERDRRIAALGYDYASQPKDVLESCNLCGASVFAVMTHRDRYGYPVEAHACTRCGLVFLNPRMTSEAYGRFYDGTYRPLVSAFHGRLIDATTIQSEQRAYARERAQFLLPFAEGLGLSTLLDIGGSTGVVAHHLATAFGLEGTVIDPAPLEVEQAQRLGLKAATGLVEDYDFGRQQFDMVIICQTVDHLLDVQGTLDRVRRLITDQGLLFVDIVDFRAAYLRYWSVEEAVKIDHSYSLTESTMTAYLRRAGFDVVRVDFAADRLHVGYLCRPAEVDSDWMPEGGDVHAFLHEMRFVQNSPRPGSCP